MKSILTDATSTIAMILVTIVLIACIANDVDHGIVYTGIAVLSGLGGYTLGRTIPRK